MMDIGTAATASVAIITVAISGFKLAAMTRNGKAPTDGSGKVAVNNNGNGKCPYHSGIQQSLDEGKDRMDTICQDISICREVILELAVAQGIDIEKYKKLVT